MSVNKYLVECPYEFVDVYRILDMFNVSDPGAQQAIKKILFAGSRGHKSFLDDMKEAIQAIQRSIDMYVEDQSFVRIDIVEDPFK